MTGLQIASLLIVMAGAFGALNALFLRLPTSIGILVVALVASFTLLGIDLAAPGLEIAANVGGLVDGFDFSATLLEGMLGLLLFAGALHVKVTDLRAQWRVILTMATLGVAISAGIVAIGGMAIFGMPLIVALIFGTIVSPTDPVAVMGVLEEAQLDPRLETQIAGESLFNDGVGYVLFLVLVGIAFPATAAHHGEGFLAPVILFFREAVGGAVLGLGLGWIVFQVMRRIDDYGVEVLITLGLAFGGYEMAVALGVSAPIMAVTAGLMIGDHAWTHAMSAATRDALDMFWRIVDEMLNAVLFLMIGFEVFAVTFDGNLLRIGAASIALVLFARLVAVTVPAWLLRGRDLPRGMIPVMTWGGLKGGISIALALSLPENEWKPIILTATYVVVVFSILVQGLTVARLARRVTAPHPRGD